MDSGKGSTLQPAPSVSAGRVTEIVISMSGYREEVRDNAKQFVNVLHQHAPEVRIAVISSGEYDDERKRFIKWIDIAACHDELLNFIDTVERTFGGNESECTNIMKQAVHEKLSLTSGSRRNIIHMGDYPLHCDVSASAMHIVQEHHSLVGQKPATTVSSSQQRKGNVNPEETRKVKKYIKRLSDRDSLGKRKSSSILARRKSSGKRITRLSLKTVQERIKQSGKLKQI